MVRETPVENLILNYNHTEDRSLGLYWDESRVVAVVEVLPPRGGLSRIDRTAVHASHLLPMAELATCLAQDTGVVLLDEPTNHLDLEATLWLESFLKAYAGTRVVISHERDLLNNVVDHILHLKQGKVTLYPGGYDSFERQYAERLGISEEEVRQRYIDQVPMKRGCTYLDVTNVVVFLASDQSNYMTGQAINVTGGQEMR